MMYGEYAGMALQMILPLIKPGNWRPPGGYDEGSGPPSAAANGALSARDEAGLSLMAMRSAFQGRLTACPETAAPQACWLALRELQKDAEAKAAGGKIKGLLSVPIGGSKELTRQAIVEVLTSIAASDMSRYVGRWVERSFLLSAMRLHVAARRARAAGMPCGPPLLRQLLQSPDIFDPASPDEKLSLTINKTEAIEVAPSAELKDPPKSYAELRYLIPCSN
jgi:hypothetical protein